MFPGTATEMWDGLRDALPDTPRDWAVRLINWAVRLIPWALRLIPWAVRLIPWAVRLIPCPAARPAARPASQLQCP